MKKIFFILIFCTLFFYPQSSEAQQSTKSVLIKINDYESSIPKDSLNDWVIEKGYLVYNPQYDSEIENLIPCSPSDFFICDLLLDSHKQYHVQKKSVIDYDREGLSAFLEDLERQFNKEPENAKLSMENGRVTVFSLSSKGIRLNKEKSLEIILSYLKSNDKLATGVVELAYDEIEPEISTDSIDNLGITTLIGEGRSTFKGSPKNRVFNIRVASNRFNGILIKPGEEFSFVKILGPVDGEHGYLPELVIKKDKTEPEFGGGICQVSTTAFRAAIYSGLKITARRNHAYPVQYYNPQGLDATIYIPRPDLRFINNTTNYILIQTEIEGTELIFRFYGTDDGRKTNVIGPKITERNPDGSMKATFTQEVFDNNGDTLIKDVFNSNYDSPSKYPHPGAVLTKKPNGWSSKEWKAYKKEHKL